MTEVHSMYHAESRAAGLKAQIDKLEGLAHHGGESHLRSV